MSDTVESSSISDAELVSMAANIMGGKPAESPVKAASEAARASLKDEEPETVEEPAEEAPEAPVKASEREVNPDDVIRRRMEKARAAKQAKAEARRQAAMAEQLREFQEMQRRTVDERPAFDVDGFKQKLRTSPLTALQELGLNLDEFTQAALEEGTPQSKMMAEMRALQARLDAFERERKEMDERRSQEARQAEVRRQEAEFCAIITEDEYPSLHEFFADDVPALLREAKHVAQEFLAKGGDPDDISDEDIAWYLEQKYSKKAEKFKGKAAARLGTQPAPSTSKPRSPSQAKASQTGKLGGRDFSSLSPEEQDAMLIEVARQEMFKAAN